MSDAGVFLPKCESPLLGLNSGRPTLQVPEQDFGVTASCDSERKDVCVQGIDCICEDVGRGIRSKVWDLGWGGRGVGKGPGAGGDGRKKIKTRRWH